MAAFNAMPALSFVCSPDPPQQSKPDQFKSSSSSTERVLERFFINAQGTGGSETKASAAPATANTTVLDASAMGASFVGRESDAISDLAALADMSCMAPLSPRHNLLDQDEMRPSNSVSSYLQNQQQQEQPTEICGVGVILEQTLEGTGIIVEKVFAGRSNFICDLALGQFVVRLGRKTDRHQLTQNHKQEARQVSVDLCMRVMRLYL